jgi:hypothetical protein
MVETAVANHINSQADIVLFAIWRDLFWLGTSSRYPSARLYGHKNRLLVFTC